MDPQVPTASTTSPKIKIIIAVVLVLLALAVAIGGYLFVTSSAMAFKGMRYLAGTFESRALYEFTWTGSKQVELPVTGALIDYARAGAAQAAIVAGDDGVQSVYLIEDKEARPLVTTPGVRAQLAIAPGGERVAYAERVATESVQDPRAFFAPASWQIKVLNPKTNETTTMGNGVAPQFFSKNGVLHLAYMTEEGLHIANLESGLHQELMVDAGNASGAMPIVVSDDGARIAVPTPAGVYTMLTLTEAEGGGFVLGAGGALTPDARTIAFKGSSIYSSARSSEEAFFYRSGAGAPETPTAFERMPFTLITKLIP